MIDDCLIIPTCDYPHYSGELLTNIVIIPEEVFDVLQILHMGKACESDGINKILVEPALQFSYPFCRSCNLRLDKCVFPTA